MCISCVSHIELSNLEVQVECEELRKKVTDLITQKDRLKKVFMEKITDYRHTVQQITGYRVDLPNAPPYNIYNVYPPYKSPSPQHVLTFQKGKDNEMCLMGTDFTAKLEQQRVLYLSENRPSIPAFLSAVALAIFEKQL